MKKSLTVTRKRVYFVLGLANSGNRMMVQALCASGCYGNPHANEFLGETPADLQPHLWPNKVTFARSIPNGETIINPIEFAEPILQAGYQIIPIHMYRKTEFAVQGHIDAGYAPDTETTLNRIDLTATLIHRLGAYLQTPVVTVIYELFVRLSEYRNSLFAQLGLPPTSYSLYNANQNQDKYPDLLNYPHCYPV